MTKYNIIALIVAAGSGERLGNTTPKQYLSLAGEPILRHSVKIFLSHPKIDAVMVVYNPEHLDLYKDAVGDLQLLEPVSGGSSRQESVRLGLEAIAKYHPQKVLIHDAARPFVDENIVSNIIIALDTEKAAIPAMSIPDTIKIIENNRSISNVSRETLALAQTPQGFIFEEILEAHQAVSLPLPSGEGWGEGERLQAENALTLALSRREREFTDDASLFEHLGKPVKIIQGSRKNFKITTKDDLQMAELLMGNNFETRIGMGFDAHKFCAPKLEQENHIMLCGVAVPHPFSLEGHSDADVGLHAAVDSILGAMSLGDIGTHFPPSDPQWKGADSAVFLRHAAKLLLYKNASITNLDITIICESPKILPHREKMCETIARILDIEQSSVSVKATTTEGMGFTGRREGIAAQAVVSIKVRA